MATRCFKGIKIGLEEGLFFFGSEQIPSKVLSLESIPMDIELILLEGSPLKIDGGCVLVCSYILPSENEKYFN